MYSLLCYYYLEEEATIETDASDCGLEAVLLQAGRPVAFASRTMTETERRYSQIEKEYLEMVFGWPDLTTISMEEKRSQQSQIISL